MSNNQTINPVPKRPESDEDTQKVPKAKTTSREEIALPRLKVVASKAYSGAQSTVAKTRAKFGSFALVLLASLLVIIYYSVIASPRYVSQVQFVVKQATSNELPVIGLAAMGTASPSTRDALILQEYIQSTEMAQALDEQLSLKSHYQQTSWDMLSRLAADSTQEEFVEFYQKHIKVTYNEMSEILHVEVQSFDADYSLKLAQAVLATSERFINSLGENMANQQMKYAQSEVQRAYKELKRQQVQLLKFQDENILFNPEIQSAALVEAINQLESSIISQKTELKSLEAYMRSDAAQIRSKQFKIQALEQQLSEEKLKLTSQDQDALNKVNVDFKDLELNSLLAADLYKSALASLELIRAEAFKKLKHLLVVEHPRLAQQDKYPQRLYSIFTWFISLILIYLVGRLIASVIKEHKE